MEKAKKFSPAENIPLLKNNKKIKVTADGVVPVRIQRQFYSPNGEFYYFAVIFGLKSK